MAWLGLAVLVVCLIPCTLRANQGQNGTAYGVAWRVIGLWHTSGSQKAISDGDAILPGSLLQPAGTGHDHSITILLPDGQRILYECFAPRDCARGFRVPSLYRRPEPLAIEFLKRVNAVETKSNASTGDEHQGEPQVSRDEAVVLVGDRGEVEVGGLAARLSAGNYSYTSRSLSDPSATELKRDFKKQGKTVTLAVPSPGLYEVLITDQLNTPRIDLLLAAIHQPDGAGTVKSFEGVNALLKDWNEAYQGWPVHDFKRDFLRSLMLHINPTSRAADSPSKSNTRTQPADVACEPQFTPIPGVFKGDTEVRLQCKTRGATIHFTVDGSQPLEGAPVYRAPIIVKGTALTIKAYATAPGREDSPVVTGIFRIGD